MSEPLSSGKGKPLNQRLRDKLKQLDADHREKCNQVVKVDAQIREITASITALPMQHNHLKKYHSEIENTQRNIQVQFDQLAEKEAELESKELEGSSRRDLRKGILQEVCESGVDVEDTFDIRTAEIRRQRALIEDLRRDLQKQQAEIVTKKEEVIQLMSDETLNKTRETLQANLKEKVEEQKVLNILRKQALETLTECQRLVEDLEERETLQKYAKNNGLLLETDTTDELIRVCRTHQEKIAAKNAAVDASNRSFTTSRSKKSSRARRRQPSRKSSYQSSRSSRSRSSSSTGSYSITRSETCDCSECRRNYRNYDRIQEFNRRQEGLTIAGARNSRRPLTLLEEHDLNGWCGHW